MGEPGNVVEILRNQRDVIEREVGFGRLGWGTGQSPTRIYLHRSDGLGNRHTWDEAIEWLKLAATRFKEVFEPRLLALAAPAVSRSRSRTVPRSANASRQARGGAPIGATSPPPEHTLTSPAHANRLSRSDGRSIETCFSRLADRYELAVERPASAYGSAWTLQSQPQAHGEHRYRYAYALWWGDREPLLVDTVAWVPPNPSTGDTQRGRRPTLGYCRNRSQHDWGHGGLLILNLFAYRATDPDALKRVRRDTAVGPHNDQVLTALAPFSAKAVAAWGSRGCLHHRSTEIRQLLPQLQRIIGSADQPTTTAEGEPFHPRRLPITCTLSDHCLLLLSAESPGRARATIVAIRLPERRIAAHVSTTLASGGWIARSAAHALEGVLP